MYKPITTSTTLLLAASLSLSACATLQDSLLVGGIMGAAAGGTIGNQSSNHDPRSTAIGAITGAAIGSLFGYLGHKEKARKEAERQAQVNALQGKPQIPTVTTPQVRAIWVEDKIENDQFISGHYIFVIDRPATFRKE